MHNLPLNANAMLSGRQKSAACMLNEKETGTMPPSDTSRKINANMQA